MESVGESMRVRERSVGGAWAGQQAVQALSRLGAFS